LISSDEAVIGLGLVATPRWTIPYSVSMPQIFGPRPRSTGQPPAQRYCPVATRSIARPPSGLVAVVDERAHVDDPLALLARDLRPVVGVGGVGQVLVLLELLVHRGDEVVGDMPLAPPSMKRLMASFLARRTMFSIMAPEEKSLKYRISLSPFW
jgi:hypothetical protein